MTSRRAGWSAVANPALARIAYNDWCEGVDLNVNELILARDYAVLHQLQKEIIAHVNRDLSNAVCRAVLGGK